MAHPAVRGASKSYSIGRKRLVSWQLRHSSEDGRGGSLLRAASTILFRPRISRRVLIGDIRDLFDLAA